VGGGGESCVWSWGLGIPKGETILEPFTLVEVLTITGRKSLSSSVLGNIGIPRRKEGVSWWLVRRVPLPSVCVETYW